ncbi:MAG TPA: hypothetical protein VLO11_14390 [Luteolibacter sp.]|nr:hypothetical protein [Luteolibacter sp.]
MIRLADERIRQIAAAAGIVLGVGAVVCAGLLLWPLIPGLAGEWLGFVVGVVTTPFFMEASFAVLGLSLVLAINHWRQKKAGDELVYLEQVEPEAGLPEHAAWAVFKDPPLEAELPTALERAEGAMAIGDHEAAGEILAGMTEAELRLPGTLAIRLELAQAVGRHDLARSLEAELQARTNDSRA